MDHQPLGWLSDSFTLERDCAVCGDAALAVVHVEDLPDYVSCGSCKSAFIVSTSGEWVLYGSISADYPKTRQSAQKHWTTLEAIRIMAASERKPLTEAVVAPTPPFGMGKRSTAAEPGAQAATPPFEFGEIEDLIDDSSNGNGDRVPEKLLEEAADTAEPEPGSRFVVTLSSKNADFPKQRCAHCLRRPALKKLLVSRKSDTYEIPICQACHVRASEATDERRISKLIAHLSSILVAALLIVGAIVVSWIDINDFDAVDLLILATLGMVGYGVPLILLLNRYSRIPLSHDAKFVRSTLRIQEAEGISFAWRNRGYAELFSAANANLVVGKLVRESESV